jgi:hypothetical protein
MSVGGIAATAIGVVGCCRDQRQVEGFRPPYDRPRRLCELGAFCFFLLNQFPEQMGKRAKELCKAVVLTVRLLVALAPGFTTANPFDLNPRVPPQESQVSIDEVARRYEHERAELEDGARTIGFLAVLTTGTSARCCVAAALESDYLRGKAGCLPSRASHCGVPPSGGRRLTGRLPSQSQPIDRQR